MIVELLCLAGQLANDFTIPLQTVSAAIVASTGAGACHIDLSPGFQNGAPILIRTPNGVDTNAGISISWSLHNTDNDLYKIQVFENGVLLRDDLDATTTSITKGVTGVEATSPIRYLGDWQAGWIYRIDVVRRSDNKVVSSATTTAWKQRYTMCSSTPMGAW